MAREQRIDIIKALEEERGTRVIAYVTSTRQGMEVPMAMDSIRKIYEHLRLIDKPKEDVQIDLFLHSNGGDGTVPWRLVTLIREYASKFSVLVPHRAFSAATLTALGADRIVMHPMGMLGPTDPTVTNPFNPLDPTTNQPVGISVEDVSAYIALIRDDAGIRHEDELVQAFNKLADNVHPLALGNVKRSISQSRMMAKKLLALHMNMSTDEHKVNEIVDNLTSKLFYHGHPINRHEARDQLGLPNVEDPTPAVKDLLWQLYSQYEQEIRMEEPFQPAMEFLAKVPNLKPNTSQMTDAATAKLAFIESVNRADVFSMDYQLVGAGQADGSINVNMVLCRQGWVNE